MNRIRYAVSLLLLAGAIASVQAQPIVKINPGSNECDVTSPPPGDPIFQLDTSGNVIITGNLSGAGCGGSGGGTGSTTFTPISAAPLQLSPSSINAGTSGGNTASVTYAAAYATDCSVTSSTGTPTGSGSCPAVSISNAGCTGSGSPTTCSGNGSVTEPTSLSGPTACSYTLTATCNPGAVTSTASLSVVASGGGGGGGAGDPPACSAVAKIGTGTGGTWSRVLTTTVIYGGGGSNKTGVDATDYLQIWSVPGTSPAWPGNTGVTTRPSASINQYFAERFVVPTDGIVTRANWAWSGSGINTNMSLAVSVCPGDFGQTNTLVTTGCKMKQANSANGLTILVNAAQQGNACTLVPGKAYYLNVLPQANLPVGDVSTSDCSGTCTPWLGLN